MLAWIPEELPVIARRAFVLAGFATTCGAAAAEPVRVLSAGALEPALAAALER